MRKYFVLLFLYLDAIKVERVKCGRMGVGQFGYDNVKHAVL